MIHQISYGTKRQVGRSWLVRLSSLPPVSRNGQDSSQCNLPLLCKLRPARSMKGMQEKLPPSKTALTAGLVVGRRSPYCQPASQAVKLWSSVASAGGTPGMRLPVCWPVLTWFADRGPRGHRCRVVVCTIANAPPWIPIRSYKVLPCSASVSCRLSASRWAPSRLILASEKEFLGTPRQALQAMRAQPLAASWEVGFGQKDEKTGSHIHVPHLLRRRSKNKQRGTSF